MKKPSEPKVTSDKPKQQGELCSKDLLACPFCGWEAVLLKITNIFGGKSPQAQCTNRKCGAMVNWGNTKTAAIRQWNNRTPKIKNVADAETDRCVISLMLRTLPDNDWATMSENNRNYWRKIYAGQANSEITNTKSDPKNTNA